VTIVHNYSKRKPEEIIVPQEKPVAVDRRPLCKRCAEQYTPRSKTQRYCETCRPAPVKKTVTAPTITTHPAVIPPELRDHTSVAQQVVAAVNLISTYSEPFELVFNGVKLVMNKV